MAVDAYMEVIVNKVSKDDTIPTSNYTYSYYNQEGGSMSTVSSDVNVGSGANIVEVMNSNNQVLESFKTGVVNKLNDISVTIGTSGVKVNGVDNIVQEIKTMGQNSVNEMVKNTSQLANVKTAIQNQELSPTINNNVDTPSVTVQAPAVTNTVDVSPIAEQTSIIASATTAIASGVTDQKETNVLHREKLTEQIEDIKFGKELSIMDSRGVTHSPRVVKALSNAEHAFNKEAHNNFDWSKHFSDNVDSIQDDVDSVENELTDLLNSLKTVSFAEIVKADTAKLYGVNDGI